MMTAVALAAIGMVGAQAAEVSYNIGVVSLYKSSGVDQDYNATTGAYNDAVRPAVQGGVDVDLGNGLYVGNWNSTGVFEKGNLEIDLYGGYAGELSNGVGYDLGYAHYIYPGQSTWNGGEMYASVSYAGVKLKLTHGLNGSTKAANGDAMERLSIGYDFAVNDKTTLNLVYGARNKAKGSYGDFLVGLTYDLGSAVSMNVNYSAATKRAEAPTGERDGRVVFGVSKGF